MSYPLMAYTYIDPSTNNTFPIVNSNFVYGTLGPCNWIDNYTAYNNNYGSLDISSNGLYGNTQLVSLMVLLLYMQHLSHVVLVEMMK